MKIKNLVTHILPWGDLSGGATPSESNAGMALPYRGDRGVLGPILNYMSAQNQIGVWHAATPDRS
jgi:hypothetical protein